MHVINKKKPLKLWHNLWINIYDTLSTIMVVKSGDLMDSLASYQQGLIKPTILVLYVFHEYLKHVLINEISHKSTTNQELLQNW